MQVDIPDTLGYHNQGYMAADPIYGSSSLDENPGWDPARWKETRPWDWYMGEMEITDDYPSYPVGGTTPKGAKAWPQMEACTGVPLYDGQPVEVGPRARLNVFKGYDEKGTIGQQIARQMEYTDCVLQDHRVPATPTTRRRRCSRTRSRRATARSDGPPTRPRAGATSTSPVSRTARSSTYSMLVPTTWNFPTCSRALTGAPWQTG